MPLRMETEPNPAPLTIALRARAAEERDPRLVKLLRTAADKFEEIRAQVDELKRGKNG